MLSVGGQMGIERSYLDETIAFYQEKQEEQAGHIAIFQNLYLIAAADATSVNETNLLTEVARNLGLQEDIEIVNSEEPLEFILPEGKICTFAEKSGVYDGRRWTDHPRRV